MKKALLPAFVFLWACGGLAAFETTKSMSLPAEGLEGIEIQAGAGSLTVMGREGQTAIEVKAEIVARNVPDKDMETFLRDRIELTLEKKGRRAVLVGRFRSASRLFRLADDGVINLSVSVPMSLAAEIDDSSGGIVVEGLAGLRIDDGSGSIRIARIGGDVEIDDGSGDIAIDNVTGHVNVDDGSGDIDIRRVGGSVTIDDGSGSIDIDEVARDVRLIDTGSGGVDISNVKGKVIRSA